MWIVFGGTPRPPYIRLAMPLGIAREYGLTGSCSSGPEVGFEEIAIDLPQARFWILPRSGNSPKLSELVTFNSSRLWDRWGHNTGREGGLTVKHLEAE